MKTTAAVKSARATRLPTLRACERAIGERAHAWVARCFEIASRIVAARLVDGVAVYGHYRGEVAEGSIFSRKSHLGFVQHGWVKLADGRILDPTRFVFEDRAPYIYVGPASPEYDEGGNQFRSSRIGEPPRFDDSEEQFELSQDVIDSAPYAHVERLLRVDVSTQEPGYLTISQLRWLANAPYDALEPHAAAIYDALEWIGRGALIPIDNLHRARRERAAGAER